MDTVLPFRALSPGTSRPKFNPRTRDSKLSLKSKSSKVALVGQGNKENRVPLPPHAHVQRMGKLKLDDSDLMTSDESDTDTPGMHDGKKNSVMSFNTQESTFSLPVAESTRCELPALKLTGYGDSTIATLHTANNGSLSSTSTGFYTPLSSPCDDSIVCISDSSPEQEKRTVNVMKGHALSVLISSDDSDDEWEGKVSHLNVLRGGSIGEKKRLYDTVVLDTSVSDEDNVDGQFGDDFVIPPSIKNYSDSDSSSGNDVMANEVNDVVIPPSPEIYSENNEEVDLSVSEESYSNRQKKYPVRQVRTHPSRSQSHNVPCDKKANCLKQLKSQVSTTSDAINESSWKEDFRLVMPESSVSSEEQINAIGNGRTELLNGVTSSISKEKYDDIAKWLTCGRKSTESVSDHLHTHTSRVEPTEGINDGKMLKHQQVHRLSLARKCSFGSESDDNFNALLESVRKKRNEKQKVKDDSFINDDSFIDDCTSDVVESPSFNIYHSDLTRSIRAEVKSVKKSVMKKKQILRHLYDSDDVDEDKIETPVIKPKQKSTFRSLRKYYANSSDSDDSEAELESRKSKANSCSTSGSKSDKSKRKGRSVIYSDDSSSEDKHKRVNDQVSKTKEREAVKIARDLSGQSSSDGTSSGLGRPEKTKVGNWRNTAQPARSSSESSSVSTSPKFNKPTSQPKKITKEVVKKTITPVTPKQISALKSTKTPNSPIRTFLTSLSGPTHEPGVRDHPEAAVYNKNFKGKKEELTRRLFKLFNREVFDRRLPDDMELEWNARLVRTAGLCYCKLLRKNGVTTRTSKIALSTKVITSPDRLRDTLIHEMCHAAVWLLNNVSGGHGPFWKAWAHKAMKRFPELPPIERCHSYNIETKYTYKCTKCGYSFGRHSKSLDVDKKRCGYCYGTFEVFLSSQGQNDDKKCLKTPKTPSAFALFVKENYGLLKQEHAQLKHGDIMKKLGEKFTLMKVKQSENGT